LAKNNDLLKKLKYSIDENPNTFESPLVRGCLKESLRLYPVAAFVGRFLDTDAEIGGYLIPKSTLVLASHFTSGRDPTNFSHPCIFLPDRWLRKENEEEHKILKSYATLPFAIGSRSCVGKKIATYQIHTLITKVNIQLSFTQLDILHIKIFQHFRFCSNLPSNQRTQAKLTII
jgi:ecdysteroid 2-hydroxylase